MREADLSADPPLHGPSRLLLGASHITIASACSSKRPPASKFAPCPGDPSAHGRASRIASHCLFIGTYCMDLGATTMLFYTSVFASRFSTLWRNLRARMTFNYECIGGVMQDLAPDFVEDVHALLDVLPANIKEYNKIFTGNVIARNRMEGVGVLTRDDAISWAVTGPSGRASGWACDVRKTVPLQHLLRTRFRRSCTHRRRRNGPLQSAHGRNGPERAHHRTAHSTIFPKAKLREGAQSAQAPRRPLVQDG